MTLGIHSATRPEQAQLQWVVSPGMGGIFPPRAHGVAAASSGVVGPPLGAVVTILAGIALISLLAPAGCKSRHPHRRHVDPELHRLPVAGVVSEPPFDWLRQEATTRDEVVRRLGPGTSVAPINGGAGGESAFAYVWQSDQSRWMPHRRDPLRRGVRHSQSARHHGGGDEISESRVNRLVLHFDRRGVLVGIVRGSGLTGRGY